MKGQKYYYHINLNEQNRKIRKIIHLLTYIIHFVKADNA